MKLLQNAYVKALLIFTAFCGVVAMINHSMNIKARIRNNHKVVCGTIIGKNVGGKQCYIDCEYSISGIKYGRSFDCTRKTHNGYLHGFDNVLVVYDSTKPELSHLIETPDDIFDYDINQTDTSGILCKTINYWQNN